MKVKAWLVMVSFVVFATGVMAPFGGSGGSSSSSSAPSSSSVSSAVSSTTSSVTSGVTSTTSSAVGGTTIQPSGGPASGGPGGPGGPFGSGGPGGPGGFGSGGPSMTGFGPGGFTGGNGLGGPPPPPSCFCPTSGPPVRCAGVLFTNACNAACAGCRVPELTGETTKYEFTYPTGTVTTEFQPGSHANKVPRGATLIVDADINTNSEPNAKAKASLYRGNNKLQEITNDASNFRWKLPDTLIGPSYKVQYELNGKVMDSPRFRIYDSKVDVKVIQPAVFAVNFLGYKSPDECRVRVREEGSDEIKSYALTKTDAVGAVLKEYKLESGSVVLPLTRRKISAVFEYQFGCKWGTDWHNTDWDTLEFAQDEGGVTADKPFKKLLLYSNSQLPLKE